MEAQPGSWEPYWKGRPHRAQAWQPNGDLFPHGDMGGDSSGV